MSKNTLKFVELDYEVHIFIILESDIINFILAMIDQNIDECHNPLLEAASGDVTKSHVRFGIPISF